MDEAPADDDFAPFPRQTRRRATRGVTLIVVVALVIAAVGTGVGLLTSGGGGSPKPTSDVEATVLSVDGLPDGASVATRALVTLRVTNRASVALEPVCTVAVYAHGALAGTVTVHAQHVLTHGQTVTAQLTVPLPHPVPVAELGKGMAVC